MKKVVILFFFALVATSTMAQITCTIKGRVINRPSSTTLLLAKSYLSISQEGKEIQIKDSGFSFTISGTEPEIYQLVFQDEIQNGSWFTIEFCTLDGQLELELYPMKENSKNRIISGGSENQAIVDYNKFIFDQYEERYYPITKAIDSIDWDDRLNDLGKDISLRLDTTQGVARNDLWELWYAKQKTGEIYIPIVQENRAQADSAFKLIYAEDNNYKKSKPSLYLYSKLIQSLSAFHTFEQNNYIGEQGTALDFLEDQYKEYAKSYPKHHYTELAKDKITNLRQIRVGGKYIDFTAPDLNGNMVKLSSQIKDKVALIDLWGSWCGPCRNTSISFIPIYDQYKDLGFTIVGVAREKKDDKSMRKAIEQDGYKWLNLLELKDRAGIWTKYGINNAAGGVYLVDRDGTILAIDPKADEVRQILAEKIK